GTGRQSDIPKFGSVWRMDVWLFATPTSCAHSSARRRCQVTRAQVNLKTLGWRSWAMAKLVFGLNQSLDGYVDHKLMPPEPGLFRHFIEQVRGLTGMVYGRRMYEVMRYWDEDLLDWGCGGARICGGVAEPAKVGRVALA